MRFVLPHLIEALVHGGMTRRPLGMSLDDMKQEAARVIRVLLGPPRLARRVHPARGALVRTALAKLVALGLVHTRPTGRSLICRPVWEKLGIAPPMPASDAEPAPRHEPAAPTAPRSEPHPESTPHPGITDASEAGSKDHLEASELVAPEPTEPAVRSFRPPGRKSRAPADCSHRRAAVIATTLPRSVHEIRPLSVWLILCERVDGGNAVTRRISVRAALMKF